MMAVGAGCDIVQRETDTVGKDLDVTVNRFGDGVVTVTLRKCPQKKGDVFLSVGFHLAAGEARKLGEMLLRADQPIEAATPPVAPPLAVEPVPPPECDVCRKPLADDRLRELPVIDPSISSFCWTQPEMGDECDGKGGPILGRKR